MMREQFNPFKGRRRTEKKVWYFFALFAFAVTNLLSLCQQPVFAQTTVFNEDFNTFSGWTPAAANGAGCEWTAENGWAKIQSMGFNPNGHIYAAYEHTLPQPIYPNDDFSFKAYIRCQDGDPSGSSSNTWIELVTSSGERVALLMWEDSQAASGYGGIIFRHGGGTIYTNDPNGFSTSNPTIDNELMIRRIGTTWTAYLDGRQLGSPVEHYDGRTAEKVIIWTNRYRSYGFRDGRIDYIRIQKLNTDSGLNCLYVEDNPDPTMLSILGELGFNITTSTTIPSDLSRYKLVILSEYSACTPETAPYVENYVSNGGSVILLSGTPSTFCGGGFSTSCIARWFGTAQYSNVGLSDAKIAYNYPLGTSLNQNDVIDHSTGWGGAAVRNVAPDATVLAYWDYGTGNIHSFIRPYQNGRVAFWAGGLRYNDNSNELFKAICSWATNFGPYEPNDTIKEAYGMLANNQWYAAYIETRFDIDWYKITIGGNNLASIQRIPHPEDWSFVFIPGGDKRQKEYQLPSKSTSMKFTHKASAVLSTDLNVYLDVPTGKDYDLFLFNSSGQVVGQSTGGTSLDERIAATVSDGLYYILVDGWSPSDYSLNDQYRIKARWTDTNGSVNLTCYTGSNFNYFSPTSVSPGGSFTNHFRVKNEGSGNSGPFKVAVYLSENTSITTSDIKVGESVVNSLAAGQYIDVITQCTVPSSTPPNNYYVGMIIDVENAVNESNENDNRWYHDGQQLTVRSLTHTVSTPSRPAGPTNGTVGQTLSFSTGGATCSQGDAVEYRFDWGDGSISSWSSSTQRSHSFSSAGTYAIKAQARCATQTSALSAWSPALSVSIINPASNIPIAPTLAEKQQAGADFDVDIVVGSSSRPVSNLFGVSFELHFTNTNYIDYVSYDKTGSFLGGNLIDYVTADETNGVVSVGISKRGPAPGVSGYGSVITLRFRSQANTPGGTQVVFSLQNVTANDPNGNAINLMPVSATTTIESGVVVWPGDTNNDGIVNQADVLPIGLNWARTGPARPNASTSWIGQICPPWSPKNATYADANGDGSINQADILPIGLNWGRTHSVFQTKVFSANASRPATAKLSIEIIGDANPNEEFWINIGLNQVTDLFGISFELLYTPTSFTDPIEAVPGPFLGQDVVFFQNIDKTAGKISVGITRKAGQGGVSGSGIVARIRAKMSSTAIVGQSLTTLILQNIQANDAAGNSISIDGTRYPLITDIRNDRDEAMPTEFSLYQNYPNPFNPTTTIVYALPKASRVRLQVFDLRGQAIKTLFDGRQEAGIHTVKWDATDASGSRVASGIYLVRFSAENVVLHRKVVLTK